MEQFSTYTGERWLVARAGGSRERPLLSSLSVWKDHFKGANHPTLRMKSGMASVQDSRYGQKDTSDQNFDYMFKLLIIGNSSVGKTSFLFRYADDSFTSAFVSTVGIDFKVFQYTVEYSSKQPDLFLEITLHRDPQGKQEPKFGFPNVAQSTTGLILVGLTLLTCGDKLHFNILLPFNVTHKIDFYEVKIRFYEDTAGQERYRTITTAYYRGAMGFILMYDITNEDSFNAVQDWTEKVRKKNWKVITHPSELSSSQVLQQKEAHLSCLSQLGLCVPELHSVTLCSIHCKLTKNTRRPPVIVAWAVYSISALWIMSTQIKTYSWDNAQVILVGNKCDMEDERVIFTERGKHLAEQLGFEFFETSAKENINVKQTFERLVDIICDKMSEIHMETDLPPRENTSILEWRTSQVEELNVRLEN
ncbi:hypothetical protein DV515_00005374 [Chloebia gouldiae]|uniref:small monomeric GTPase n=1 Tax=Chloebia gouldiae TaxID=44316 RepID=A0A3L8SNR4_CHLGU|nr:hypothetical protein DV515_00005374 [Chloebia gouldiae]